MDYIFCWILISNLTSLQSNYMPPDIETRLHVCSNILAHTPEGQDPYLALAIGWQESSYTDAEGKWLCTRKGTLVKTKAGTHRCITRRGSRHISRLTRAVGPMQILSYYHCKGKDTCKDTERKVKVGVRLLYSLVKKHGKTKGIAIYAGGTVNPKSLRYARRTLKLEKRIQEGDFPNVFSMPLPKDFMWLWEDIK